MTAQVGKSERVFKTAWFSKAAKKAHIADDELCAAIRQVMLGQADNLGGGVFKKRLSKNQYRSIILAKGGQYWVYEYLFAKKDRDNIAEDELAEFRKLAKAYAVLTAQQVSRLMQNNSWMEICT
ncbi:MAG: type II toxin-antitoxin system RelE/ParE family toxin [Acidobacteriia bacterium]|nr:type II toxin-antitoxin system RelE/ParE family toxin [Terriglobia bacterium]